MRKSIYVAACVVLLTSIAVSFSLSAYGIERALEFESKYPIKDADGNWRNIWNTEYADAVVALPSAACFIVSIVILFFLIRYYVNLRVKITSLGDWEK